MPHGKSLHKGLDKGEIIAVVHGNSELWVDLLQDVAGKVPGSVTDGGGRRIWVAVRYVF